ncbi:YceD family protein [Sulfitobacter pacificus]|uniref:YceD family protein n=1 Tax=Sulfitobacter pacificus TaxID=1499314 RepID=UPI0031099585
MAQLPPSDTALRVAELSQTAENTFALRPDAEALKEIAAELGFETLRKLSFSGRIIPLAGKDWTLEGRLGATVVQPCVVTLEPVMTRVDTDVTRHFLNTFSYPDEPEVEMPEDDTSEPLGSWIDPGIVMREALALAAPDYPRKDDAELGQLVYTKPGETPMTDEDARPFAGLADFKSKLEKDGH